MTTNDPHELLPVAIDPPLLLKPMEVEPVDDLPRRKKRPARDQP
jgi:hypothetical protein